MRISDWSSDVCSSDLGRRGNARERPRQRRLQAVDLRLGRPAFGIHLRGVPEERDQLVDLRTGQRQVGHVGAVAAATPDALVRAGIALEVFGQFRSEEHTSELQSLMRISYAVFGLTKKTHDSESTIDCST